MLYFLFYNKCINYFKRVLLMLKRFIAVLLVLCAVLCFCGCDKLVDTDMGAVSEPTVSSTPEPENPYALNTLTGVYNLDKDKANLRPVAVMIDNDSLAQRNSQFSVSKADIVYETEIEAGITRLMAVFSDISKIGQIGDIRSARYVYVDLAMGHNAIYVHSGKDPTYCKPHLADLDNFEITYGYYGKRIHYGNVMSWQELFTSGETLTKAFSDKKWKTTDDNKKTWQNFAKPEEKVTLSGAANKATVGFNNVYISYFNYNADTGLYTKTSKFTENYDREDNSPYTVKNVFVLKTDMSMYPDNYRRKIDLVGGSGYYIVNGTYEEIKWKKGASTDSFVFTKADGTPLTVNAGNSWVCIIKQSGKVSFE